MFMQTSGLFDSVFKARNESHFAAIVRVAMDDGVISDEEQAFLDRLAHNLSISRAKYELILKNYASYPINPPLSYSLRLERLYDLSRMVHIDHMKGDHKEVLLRKMAIGLGFHVDRVDAVVDRALAILETEVDLEAFSEAIKRVNG